ncbi:hypothetical protein TSUD_177110 [Trifolium subterraneum]|uniref:Reverse transcriptase domain-containing protein n=1 Tax=Trifolium subterraneum TaxID=3900 RepID=A0A2Z6NW49_TRISU|nr:hypothetical protein TSUD_177110 [Trifolium subterraneum]
MGRKFTWVQPNGRCMSRLDRVLISQDWDEIWGVASLWRLKRDVSDHCPLIVRYDGYDWEPKPFRFNNHWLKNKEFFKVVATEWESYQVNGWKGFVLHEKFKQLKGALRAWNREVYGSVDTKIEELIAGIELLDLKGEGVGLVEEEVWLRNSKFNQLWMLLKSKDSMEFQKSRSRWLKEGDANTGFFHACVKNRKRTNSIVALKKGREWLCRPEEIRSEVVTYFRKHFEEVPWERPTLDGVDFLQLSNDEAMGLEAPFGVQEVVEVIELSDGNKSPGPDGFNFSFFKKFWGLIELEVMGLFQEFHNSARLPSCFVSYFITLIPKLFIPQQLCEFRPISLLGSLYKLMSKVLSNRLRKVMNSIISSNQSAFIKGRHLADGVVVANEVVDLAKRAKKECLVFKVDFEKAYDSVSWSFLDYMLRRVGFGEQWRAWMKTCVCNGKLLVLVNGCPTEEVSISRGLKQGDPLAPFLFLLVAEGLTALSKRAACVENLWAMNATLRWFEFASGLRVNFSKSCLMGVNVPSDFLLEAASFLYCKVGSLPFTYLGLPVGANLRHAKTWEPVIKTIKNRLFSWRNRYVSLGGRVILINSVLASIPVFYLSFLKMPVKVRMSIVRMQKNFLWGGTSSDKNKIAWVSWKDVCRPKGEGGLGVRDLKWFNLSLMAKWWWRLLMEEGPLWRNVLDAKYGGVGRANLSIGRGNHFSLWWKDLVGLGTRSGGVVDWTQDIFSKKLGCGGSTSFWLDRWVGIVPLCVSFPRLYNLSLQPALKIKDMGEWVNEIWCWKLKWRRSFFVWEESLYAELLAIICCAELIAIIAIMRNYLLSITKEVDSWSFMLGDLFSVSAFYMYLYNKFLPPSRVGLNSVNTIAKVWDSWAPNKVVVFSWQALLGRLPTKENLVKRGISLEGTMVGCVMCGGGRESEDHLFAACSTTWEVWSKVHRWFGLTTVIPGTIGSLFQGFLPNFRSRKHALKGINLVWHAVMWVIWQSRNERIFRGVVVGPEEIF